MTYEQATHLAQTGGLVVLAMCFVLAVIYAMWPGNKEKFDHAARNPLEDGDHNG
ncbi:MAG: cbb3-type cytochrome c oxidase subunit 3 [Terricaulis sp.]